MSQLRYGAWVLLRLFMFANAYSTPSPQDLRTDLTILVNNDLLGASSSSTEAILLLSPLPHSLGRVACATIHESLLVINTENASFNLTSTLGHLVGTAPLDPSQRYWVAAASTDGKCLSTDYLGQISIASCMEVLPVLCTQTAPFSNATYADTSRSWQINVLSGGQMITGFRDRLSFRFLGVRFANKPERFGYAKVYKEPGTQSALLYGPECYQSIPQTGLLGISTSSIGVNGSEDCLFLNIFTPFLPAAPDRRGSTGLKPVMMFIHGGEFLYGNGGDPIYDGGNLASRGDVVVVTINYRLGTFGFLALDDGSTNGNYALSDQIAALDWLHTNIAAFGGDPSRITLVGQSAGAVSIRALLSSPPVIGKFAAVILQSHEIGPGIAQNYTEYPSIAAEFAAVGKPILAETECSNATSQVACLRALDAATLATLSTSAAYIVVDGKYIVRPNLVLNGSVDVAHVHMLLGVMQDEMAGLFPYLGFTNVTQSLLAFGFNSSVVADVVRNSTLFPLPTSNNSSLDVFNTTVHVTTDYSIRCLDQALAYAGATHKQFQSTWFYEFERSYQPAEFDSNKPLCDAPITATSPHGDPSLAYFRCHSGDIYYTFGNFLRQGAPIRDTKDILFAQLIVDSWTSFARTYNPNPTRLFLSSRNYASTLALMEAPGGIWQPVTAGAQTMRRLDWPTTQSAFDEQAQCKLLNLPITYYL